MSENTQETKQETIRRLFEEALVDVLQGRPLLDKDGEPLLTEDGRVAIARPGAADLAVVRAFIKDQVEKQPSDPKSPQPGRPTGALAEFMERNGGKLPFGIRAQ